MLNPSAWGQRPETELSESMSHKNSFLPQVHAAGHLVTVMGRLINIPENRFGGDCLPSQVED